MRSSSSQGNSVPLATGRVPLRARPTPTGTPSIRCLLGLCLLTLSLTVSAIRPAVGQVQRPAAAHYDVVALRVEFQPDTTRFTTGDGTFEGPLFAEGLAPSVDPLPHDAAYFEAHLAFLEHYVARVSDGKTRVTTHLVPEVVRVSKPMAAYSPTGFEADSDGERAKLVALVEEAWRTASEQSDFDLSGFAPERTAFVLFHAGVGRDIELVGTTLDKTPQDLPSLVFDSDALTRLGEGTIAFNGFPVSNTLVIPRTETRQGFNFIEDEPFLLELSINGLLAASFFNYLGVPDLFKTDTGESAIGPYGLMDPLGIFAFNGLFPPEPSGWTKYFLGWTEPAHLTGPGPEHVTVAAAGLNDEPEVIRVDISSAEYFLIENRHRDPEGDGLVLHVWRDGQIVEQRVANGDESFNRFDVSGFVGGVVVGVDNYDFALPGGVDEEGNALYGGVLIWHVDERQLAAGLATGGVNNDPRRRAVDLEEADSAQDMGHPSTSPFGPAADQGSPFDFFYEGNPITVIAEGGERIRLYENRFGPDTVPNSDSNEGGPSFVVLEDFSKPGARMTFVYQREPVLGVTPRTDLWQELQPGFAMEPGSAVIGMTGGARVGVFARAGLEGRFFLVPQDGASSGPVPTYPAAAAPVLLNDGRVAVWSVEQGREANPVEVLLLVDPELGTEERIPFPRPFAPSRGTPLVRVDEPPGEMVYAVHGEEPVLVRFNPGAGTAEVVVTGVPEEVIAASAAGAGRLVLVGRRETVVWGGDERWTYDIPVGGEVGHPVFGRDAGGLLGVIPLVDERALLLLHSDGETSRINAAAYGFQSGEEESRLAAYPVLADLDGDARLDILVTFGRSLLAFTQGGALVAGFPVALPAPAVAQPLVAELTDSDTWSVIVALTNGSIYAYDVGRANARVDGFPLAVGAAVQAAPLLHDRLLIAVSGEGAVRAWTLEQGGSVLWGRLHGDDGNRSFVELGDEPGPGHAPSGLLVEAETYNWPNPIRDGGTYLRCMTTRDAVVHVTIVSSTGALIEELEFDVPGGVPVEHWWETTAPSGVYVARVTATGADGSVETRLVRMAIIR